MDLGGGRKLPCWRSSQVLKGPKTGMTHSVKTVKIGTLGVGRDISMVLGDSLKRPRAPGSLGETSAMRWGRV